MDFLFEPWFLALFGTIFGGVFMKSVENFAPKEKEVEAKQNPQPKAVKSSGLTEFECAVYDTHIFEKKLAENNVIARKDITLCGNEDCPLCEPERVWRGLDAKVAWQKEEIAADPEGWERFQELKRTDKRWKGYTYHDYKFQMKIKHDREKELAKQRQELKSRPEAGKCRACYTWLPSISKDVCDRCNMVRRRSDESDFVNSLAEKMKNQSAIIIPDEGMKFEPIRPAEVPEFAHYTDNSGIDGYIRRRWTWIDPSTGYQMARQQTITPQSYTHSFKKVEPIKVREPEYGLVKAGTISTGPR